MIRKITDTKINDAKINLQKNDAKINIRKIDAKIDMRKIGANIYMCNITDAKIYSKYEK